eukprot:g22890.t1
MQKCVAERGGPLRHEERLRKLDFAKTVAEQRELQLQQALEASKARVAILEEQLAGLKRAEADAPRCPVPSTGAPGTTRKSLAAVYGEPRYPLVDQWQLALVQLSAFELDLTELDVFGYNAAISACEKGHRWLASHSLLTHLQRCRRVKSSRLPASLDFEFASGPGPPIRVDRIMLFLRRARFSRPQIFRRAFAGVADRPALRITRGRVAVLTVALQEELREAAQPNLAKEREARAVEDARRRQEEVKRLRSEASIWRLLQLAFLMLPLAIYWPVWFMDPITFWNWVSARIDSCGPCFIKRRPQWV